MKVKNIIQLLLTGLCFVMPYTAFSETPSDAELLEEVPPPPKIQDGEALDAEPQINIRKEGKKTVHEYRVNGELYMMKIIPDHGVAYYLYRENHNSDWVNIGPNPPLAVPTWTLFTF